MATQKRGRACEACSRIKIRCDLGASPDASPPCERCIRLNKKCILSAPKRQKDRVLELEAQVEALTRLLEAQGIQDPDSLIQDASTPSTDSNPRKRRIVQDVSPSSTVQAVTTVHSSGSPPDLEPLSLETLDLYVPLHVQQQLVDRYTNEQVPALPLVPLARGMTLQKLRARTPMLLYAVIYAAGAGVLDIGTQERVVGPLLDRMAKYSTLQAGIGGVTAAGLMEVLQSLQIASLWYRSPKRVHNALNVQVIIETASELASRLSLEEDLGDSDEGVNSADAWRTRLVSHTLASAMSMFSRKPSPVLWDHDYDLCVLQMQYSPLARSTDSWLAQLIRAERLCEDIAQHMELFSTEVYLDLGQPAMKSRVQNCRNKILNWRMTVPRSLRTPTLLLWEHMATVFMHEPVLHTPTNGKSFSAPFISEHLSVTDFPAPPIVTEEYITAVFELTSSAQAMLDVFLSLDTTTVMALPGLLFSPRAAYALFILAKLFIATSAPGSTLGVALDGSMLLVGDYADRMIAAGTACREIDERCVPARILFAAVGIKEWYNNFISILGSASNTPGAVQSQELNSFQPAATFAELPPPLNPTSDQNANDWNTYLQYGDSASFGFDLLFAGSSFYEEMQINDATSYLKPLE